MAASALLKNTVSVEERMVASKETKKHCTLKKAVPAIKHKKTCFYEQLPWISLSFISLRFLYICQSL